MNALAPSLSTLSLYRLFPLRERYLMTRKNSLRLRHVVGSVLAIAICAVGLFGTPFSTLALRNFENIEVADVSLPLSTGIPANALNPREDANLMEVVTKQPEIMTDEVKSGISSGIRKASFALKKDRPRVQALTIKTGDTIAGLLQESGMSGEDAATAVKALGKYYNVRKVKSGQTINLDFKPSDDGLMMLTNLSMKLDPIKTVHVTQNGPEDFKAELTEAPLVPRVYARKVRIQNSLYGSAARANVPPSVIGNMIRIYSWNIDFQRDIRAGDKIEVLYEAFETEDGQYARYGDVLFANLNVGGKQYPIYRFDLDDKRIDYFQPNGVSIRKILMKTPVDGARISSGFGMRRHPVLGYSKMHKGMDFAASTGTPIYAAGDGVIEHAGRKGSYGNYVRIRHNGKLKTAYAHMHRIKSGLKIGSKVRQGQVIGTVGTTGRSTGPHLHYEVLMNGKQVNPRSVKLPTGEELTGKQLKRFQAQRSDVYQQYVSLSQGMKYAEAP